MGLEPTHGLAGFTVRLLQHIIEMPGEPAAAGSLPIVPDGLVDLTTQPIPLCTTVPYIAHSIVRFDVSLGVLLVGIQEELARHQTSVDLRVPFLEQGEAALS
jgi:hypothetical protein